MNNDDDFNLNELATAATAADDATGVDAAEAREQVAMESPRMEGGRSRKSGSQPRSLPRLFVRICLVLVTVVALATIFFRGENSSGLQVDDATFVLYLKPAEIYGKAFVECKDQRLDDESSLQQMLSEQKSNGTQQIVLRTAGGVSQGEIDWISRLIRQNLPETRIVVVGSSGRKSGE